MAPFFHIKCWIQFLFNKMELQRLIKRGTHIIIKRSQKFYSVELKFKMSWLYVKSGIICFACKEYVSTIRLIRLKTI